MEVQTGSMLLRVLSFDPTTQRTIEKHERLLISPAREFLVDNIEITGEDGQEWTEFHIPLLYTTPSSLLDFLPKDTLVLFDDWDAFEDTVNEFEEQADAFEEAAESVREATRRLEEQAAEQADDEG